MKYGSLFSGIGGFDLGFDRAGMECAWQCEIDKNCQSLLQKRFGVKIYDDVKKITKRNFSGRSDGDAVSTSGDTTSTRGKQWGRSGSDIGDGGRTEERDAESVDLICGGFPCQDVSIAGKRAGLAGKRSGLWGEFARIIEELKPGWVVVENVPGLLSSNSGRDFETVISQMVEFGYGVCWRILDAQYFGVAQRRRRVFIVGSLGDGRSAEVLFEREGVRWNPPARGEKGEKPAYAIRAGASHSGDKGDGGINTNLVADTISSIEGRCWKGINSDNLDHMVANTYRMTAFGEYSEDGSGGALKTRDYKDATDLVATSRTLRQGKEGGGKGYLGSEEKAMTLGGQQQFVGVRRLTPTECERLQGFPDGWTAGQSDSTRYKQLGNAVAVPVAEWIGKRIKRLF